MPIPTAQRDLIRALARRAVDEYLTAQRQQHQRDSQQRTERVPLQPATKAA